ncbi:MAG TPA: copper chaperone PCu(A)C [Alphaproteobacteria bacterium]|jgi:copper(I)-binding protein|nr:copper chaperone PCu(A)C [Alphaproteobacteria bacterium]
MRYLLLLPMLLALAFPALADGTIRVSDAKSRPTAPGGMGVVYMTVVNQGSADDSVTGLSTPIADKADMHRTVKDDGGIMKMEAVAALPLKANDAATFGPGGLHVMLTGLKKPLAVGDSFPLTLTFAHAAPVTVTVSVQSFKPAPQPMKDGAMKDMPGMKM